MNRAIIGFALAVCGCEDALDQRLAIVTEPRVLAIVAEPPEVRPGADALVTALVAGPDGTLADIPAWSLCTAPKPPTEDNAVADGCLADQITPLGAGATITATVPVDACRTFGPDVASTGFRPRDPDSTGGFYQPIRADVIGRDAFGFARITCNLANAPGDVAQAYKTMYVANANPLLAPLAIDGAPPTTVAAGATVTLTAAWPADAVESFLYFDPGSQQLIARREAMRLSWFATGGTLAVDASAIGELDPTTSVTTTWHVPATPGPATLWLVLRDSRGGLATQTIAIDVR